MLHLRHSLNANDKITNISYHSTLITTRLRQSCNEVHHSRAYTETLNISQFAHFEILK